MSRSRTSYQEFIQDAERFCTQAEEALEHGNENAAARLRIASVLFSYIAIEAFINNMMSDFVVLPVGLFTVHERGFLAERAVTFADSGANAGRFIVDNRREYKPLEDKIMFLIARFSDGAIDKGSDLWRRFKESKKIRDGLTHPRKNGMTTPSTEDATNAVQVARDVIGLVAREVWGQEVNF